MSKEKNSQGRIGSPTKAGGLAVINEDGERDEEFKELRSNSGMMRRMQTIGGYKINAQEREVLAHNFTNSIEDNGASKRVSFHVPIIK